MTAALCARPNCTRTARAYGLCDNHHRHTHKHIGYVDILDVIDHVNQLRAAGLGARRIAKIAGISIRTVERLYTHQHKWVTARTAAAIQAVPLPTTLVDPNIANSANVDAVGSIRRLRALVAMGHSPRTLATRLGWCLANIYPLTSGRQKQVSAHTARLIAELYDELEMVPGKDEKAKKFAAARLWAPTLAWDEDTIDDPAAEPTLCRVDRQKRTYRCIEEFTEIVNDHRELGRPDKEIAERLGLTIDAFHLRLRRAGLKRKAAA